MKKLLALIITAILCLCCFSSCSLSPKIERFIPNEQIMSVEIKTTNYEVGIDEITEKYVLTDEQSDAIKSLLNEITYCKRYNILKEKWTHVNDMKYIFTFETQKVVLSENHIYVYDSNDNLIKHVEFNSSTFNDYIEEINEVLQSSEDACEHIWDDGIEVEGGTGAYLMEYTCTVCDEKYQQIITIIPPDNDDSDCAKYKLTIIDYWGYLVKPLDEYYEAGEKVAVTLAFLSGPSVGIELNGEYIGENADTKYDGVYPIITFTMPAKDSVLYTTQNGNIGFISTFSRAGFVPNIYDNALNASKLNDNNPWNLPIYKFDTFSDLEKFKNDFGGENGFNYGWDEVPSLNDATKYYDEVFFDRYTLMLIYIEATSGSYRFGFKDVTIDGNYFCIHVEQTNNPQIFTDDMAGWFITVAVPDSMVEGYTEFDADLTPYN